MPKTYSRIDANWMEVSEPVEQKVKHSIQDLLDRKKRLEQKLAEVNELISAWNAL